MSKHLPQTLTAGSIKVAALQADEGGMRRFKMMAYTGAEVPRAWGRAIFDVAGVEAGTKLPILLDHDSTQRAGFADKITMGATGIELEGYISPSTAAGREVEQLSDEGFPWQASVQVIVGSWEELDAGDSANVNGREITGPVSIARQSRLLESSFLMAGADKDTFAVALAAQEIETMDPSAFEAAHPEAVAQWRTEAVAQARSELATYLEAFPGREAWAAQRYAEGLTATEAKAALADVLAEELAAARQATADNSSTLATLTQQAQPGVGFDGNSAQGDELTQQIMDALPLEQRCQLEWIADPGLRAEFADSLPAYQAFVRREG